MKKILVPIDGSKPSTEAVKKAIMIAKAFDSEITLLTVITGKNSVPYDVTTSKLSKNYYEMLETVTKMETDYANYVLDKIVEELDVSELKIAKKVVIGDAADEIVKMAETDKYDLIVMGHRGLNPMKRLLVGSVARSVIELAPCSVLTVKILHTEIIS